MASFDINAVRAQIKTLLQSVAGLAFVYDFNNPNVDGYPCAIFDVSDEQAAFFDEVSNLRTIQFTINILQEISVAGEQAAKTQLDAVVKDVVNLFEKASNTSLSGTVDWIMPLTGSRKHIATPQGGAYAQEILLKANVVSSIL